MINFSFLFNRTIRTKTCPKCGHKFRCETNDTCWCDSLNISRENLCKIRQCYLDCLCEECLKEYEDKNPLIVNQ